MGDSVTVDKQDKMPPGSSHLCQLPELLTAHRIKLCGRNDGDSMRLGIKTYYVTIRLKAIGIMGYMSAAEFTVRQPFWLSNVWRMEMGALNSPE